MNDVEFATELVLRLNKLCEDDAAKAAVLALLESKVDVGTTLDHHKSCHVSIGGRMGPLAMLNGLVGRATIGAGWTGLGEGQFMGFYLVADCKDSVHIPVQNHPTPGKGEG